MTKQKSVINNPADYLKKLKESTDKKANLVKKFFAKIEKITKDFKDIGEAILFLDESLAIKASYLNNDVSYLINSLKITVTPWDNNYFSSLYKCGLNIKVKFIFADGPALLSENRKWECYHTSLKLIEKIENDEKIGLIVNLEDSEKTLKIKNFDDFEKIIEIIKTAFKDLGLAYNE
jgi:hypothetical protein